jgi:hypothetical protein
VDQLDEFQVSMSIRRTPWFGGRRIGRADEIRAQYGGFFLAAALVNGLALLGMPPRQASFIVDAVVFGGLITRIASLAIQGKAA